MVEQSYTKPKLCNSNLQVLNNLQVLEMGPLRSLDVTFPRQFQLVKVSFPSGKV